MCTRWQQVNGLDHKLGSLLIEEELKMKDSLIHSLKALKDELQHEIVNTQVRPLSSILYPFAKALSRSAQQATPGRRRRASGVGCPFAVVVLVPGGVRGRAWRIGRTRRLGRLGRIGWVRGRVRRRRLVVQTQVADFPRRQVQ